MDFNKRDLERLVLGSIRRFHHLRPEDTRIIVAVDGSDHSMKALELAIEIAKVSNAQLSLIHVFDGDNVPNWFKEFAEVEGLGPRDYFDVVDRRIFAPVIARAKEYSCS